MAVFTNKTFNLIYIHALLQALVMSGGEGFAYVYLLKAGIDTSIVLLSIAAMFFSRIFFRRLVLPVALRFGIRKTLIGAVIVEGATYLLLPMITEAGALLVIYLALWAISSSFYWTTYHAYVARIGNAEHSGQQVSAMEFAGAIASIISPLIMGFLLTWFNAWVGFGFIALAMGLAALPFVVGPDIPLERDVTLPRDMRVEALQLMFMDGIRAAATHFVWLIALFLTLSSSYVSYGGALALAGFTGAVFALFVGKWVDLGKGLRAARIGFGAMIVSAIAKCFGYHLPVTAVGANVLYSAAVPSYFTAFNSQMYNLSRRSPCVLRFHITAEAGWDLGMTVGCSFAALLIYLGFGFFWPIALGIMGCVGGYVLLTRIMGEN